MELKLVAEGIADYFLQFVIILYNGHFYYIENVTGEYTAYYIRFDNNVCYFDIALNSLLFDAEKTFLKYYTGCIDYDLSECDSNESIYNICLSYNRMNNLNLILNKL